MKQIPFLILIVCIFCSCGHRKSPTGGPEDTEKPEIISVFPSEFSNISDQDIEVVFSKPIDRSTIMSGLYIYPPILQKKFKWDKNTLIVKILEKLEDNTSYFFTFNTNIKGERKNNLDKDYTFVYSCGELAGNRISGTVDWEDPEDSILMAKFTLMTADSTFILSREIKTSAFQFDHLNNFDHILEAYADKNKNGKYDYGDEPYFFQTIPAAAYSSVQVEMAYEDTIKPAVKSVQAIWNNELHFTFDEPVLGFNDLAITSDDSLSRQLKIKTHFLKNTVLTVLTLPMDSLRYRSTFLGLQDLKNNLADSSSIIFNASAVVDSLPPKLLHISPRNGETINSDLPEIRIEFSEIILETGFHVSLTDVEKKKEIPLQLIAGNSKIYKLKPAKKLENYSSYRLSIEAEDVNGNKFPDPHEINFIVIVR